MGDLSKNFNRREFRCQCERNCGADTVDTVLLEFLQRARDKMEVPFEISSGHRCPTHNRAVDGTRNSWHLKGRAADIWVKGMEAEELYAHLDALDTDNRMGLICYPSKGFVHVDSRGEPYRECKE